MVGNQSQRWIFAAFLFTAAATLPATTMAAETMPVETMAAAVLPAALSSQPDLSDDESFAGRLLVAAPDMPEPFKHAVIFMAQHSRDGALGIVINWPIDRIPIARLLQDLGADASGITDSVQVYLGGPVSLNTAFVLHSADYHCPGTVDIDGRIALSGAADALRDIGLGKGPGKSLVALGYAGWAPSQLEDELARGSWVAVPEDPALVFDDDRAKVWADAMARHKSEP